MIIRDHRISGEPVTLNVLPPQHAEPLWDRWLRHVEANEGGVIGLDVETTAIDDVLGPFEPEASLRMVQFGSRKYAWALDPHDDFWRPRISALLHSGSYRFVSHTNYDPLWIGREFGVPVDERYIDTIIMAGLLFPGVTMPKDLKDLTDRLIDPGLKQAEIDLIARFKELAPTGQRVGKKLKAWGFTNVPLDDFIFGSYAGLDAIYVRRLLDIFSAMLKDKGMGKLSQREQRIARQCTRIRQRGHKVDREWTARILGDIEEEYESAAERVSERIGAKPGSPKRGDWLIDRGVKFTSVTPSGLPKLTMPSATQPGTLPQLLDRYSHDPEIDPEVVDMLRDMVTMGTHKNLVTNLRIVLRSASVDGFVHPEIKTQAAHTGRMSIVKPAMQTFKKNDPRLRGCFVSIDGHVLIGADYDNQETRIAAAYSQDPALLRVIFENLNQHELTAELIFGLKPADARKVPDDGSRSPYDKAKTADFAQQYGTGPATLGDQIGLPSRVDSNGSADRTPEAREIWLGWREAYSTLVEWTDRMAKSETIINPWGRRIPSDPWRSYANGNYAIQSTGRELLADAMVKMEDLGWGECLWLPVHDELVLQVPEDEAEQAMADLEFAMKAQLRNVPLTATAKLIGHRWGTGE